MYLLDTNVVSELRRGKRAEPAVIEWAATTPEAPMFLSVVTIFEVERGILSIERRDPDQARALRHWLQTRLLPEFEDRILPVDVPVARRSAALHVPDPRPERDALIAATALVHGMTVVTRNVRDFEAMDVAVLNPWERVAPPA